MEDNNQSISEFIKKLKTIDIGELLEKAQTIKIEDLRSLKWKDIYNSRLFFPTIGILLAISSSIFILIPSNRKTTSIRIQSKLFLNETRELPSLQNNLSNSLLIKNELIKKTRELYSLVINKEILINIPRLLNDSAERANINVTEIRPISKDQVSCFYSEEQRENINPMRGNNNNRKLGDIISKLMKNPKLSEKLDNLDAIDVWKEMIGASLCGYITDQKIYKGVLYVKLKSAVVRNELSYKRSDFISDISSRLLITIV